MTFGSYLGISLNNLTKVICMCEGLITTFRKLWAAHFSINHIYLYPVSSYLLIQEDMRLSEILSTLLPQEKDLIRAPVFNNLAWWRYAN